MSSESIDASLPPAASPPPCPSAITAASQQQQERLRLLESVVVHANDSVIITEAEPINSPGPRILYVNDAFTRVTGYRAEEVLGKTPRMLHGPKTDRTTLAKIRFALQNWQPILVELINYRKDRSEFWVELSIVPVADSTGWYTHWVAIQRDITERKRAEAESHRQYLRRQVFADITLKIRQSLQLEDILQTTVDEIRQLLNADRVLIHSLQPDHTTWIITESLQPGIPSLLGQSLPLELFPSEQRLFFNQGQVRVVPDLATDEAPSQLKEFLQQFQVKARLVVPILQRDRLWGLLAVHQCSQTHQWLQADIELLQQLADQVSIALSQSQLLAAARESERRFRVMANSAPVLLWMADIDRELIFFNQSWLNFTGRTLEQEMGQGWAEGVHADDYQYFIDTYLSAFQVRHSFQIEYRLRRADGKYRWVLNTGTPRFHPDGSFAGYIGSCVDISDRKQAELKLIRAFEQEKELNELKSRFISMTSHEFRTPLSTILASSELLEYYSHLWSDAEKQEHLKTIQTAVQHMIKMLDEVLMLGSAEAGKLSYRPTWFDLEAFCHSLVTQMQFSTTNHLVNLAFYCPTTKVYMDEKLLRHVLNNLLSNAIKYSPVGGVILMDVTCDEQQMIFSVKDQGIGIPPTDQCRLFETFHRAANVGTIPGTGLGLAIVKQCVDVMGGRITVASEVNVGTEFRVTLPLISGNSFHGI
ncbi:PAS domain S-box protein [Pantanalinema rosaneae CENA516]|uniref:PAS domain-containing sensor histidine kinase n=1 Tax=Pantanalinema rosaneae TaxID=1620701 RepID=UPI003D6DF8EE